MGARALILYLDASALLKALIPEPLSELVIEASRKATSLATSRVAYVECCSGLARRQREGLLNGSEHAAARQALADRWSAMAAVEVDEFAAGELARKHGLRALDAVHLAAAMLVRGESREEPVVFCTFDARQAAGARAERFEVVPQR